MILQYFPTYYSKQQLNRINDLHRMLGYDEDCSFSSRIALELAVMNKILSQEDPKVMQKLAKKNIHVGLLLYEYLYSLFSQNFSTRMVVELWNYYFTNKALIPQKLLLTAVVLFLNYSRQLYRVNS